MCFILAIHLPGAADEGEGGEPLTHEIGAAQDAVAGVVAGEDDHGVRLLWRLGLYQEGAEGWEPEGMRKEGCQGQGNKQGKESNGEAAQSGGRLFFRAVQPSDGFEALEQAFHFGLIFGAEELVFGRRQGAAFAGRIG